jgi:hypothetical protein
MKRGNSLVGLLVVIAIIAVLAVVFMRGNNTFSASGTSPRADGLGTTIPGLAMAKARDDVCRSNLHQIRMSVGMAHDNDPEDSHWPATLEETGIGSPFYECPLGHEHYNYNPQTGEIKCVHPGHHKY